MFEVTLTNTLENLWGQFVNTDNISLWIKENMYTLPMNNSTYYKYTNNFQLISHYCDIDDIQRWSFRSGLGTDTRKRWCFTNTVVSNHVNSDHVPSFSCLDVWTNRQATSGVYAITVTTSAYHSRRCGRL